MNSDDSPFASRRESPGIAASPIDRAIDRAVRKMMQVDPPPGLRRRVMARIEQPQRRSFFVPAFAVAAAGVAVLVLGVIATLNDRADRVPAAAPTTAAVEKAPAVENRIVEAVPDPVPVPRAQRVRSQRRTGFRREPIPMAPVADIFGTPANSVVATSDPAADAVWTAPAVPSLDEIIAAPLPLIVRPVGVPPIETLPIVIAPLGVGRPATVPPGLPR
jgi:hypothetical protein